MGAAGDYWQDDARGGTKMQNVVPPEVPPVWTPEKWAAPGLRSPMLRKEGVVFEVRS